MNPLKLDTEDSVEDITDQATTALGSTVGSFSQKLHRKLKELQDRDETQKLYDEKRHARILHAMNAIRKALQETCRIDVTDRFTLDLDISDWEGWPRLKLHLIDLSLQQQSEYGLIVTVNDRGGRGLVDIKDCTGKTYGQVNLSDSEESARVPMVLKKSVRTFLDLIADYVLNPDKPAEILANETKPLDTDPDPVAKKLKEEDLFTESLPDDNLVERIEETDPL